MRIRTQQRQTETQASLPPLPSFLDPWDLIKDAKAEAKGEAKAES